VDVVLQCQTAMKMEAFLVHVVIIHYQEAVAIEVESFLVHVLTLHSQVANAHGFS